MAAVAAEDFALAATLRDELRATREGDALLAASARLSDAVAAEDHAEAARLRDPRAVAHPGEDAHRLGPSHRRRARARARSRFVPERSDPENGAYFFSYARLYKKRERAPSCS